MRNLEAKQVRPSGRGDNRRRCQPTKEEAKKSRSLSEEQFVLSSHFRPPRPAQVTTD